MKYNNYLWPVCISCFPFLGGRKEKQDIYVYPNWQYIRRPPETIGHLRTLRNAPEGIIRAIPLCEKKLSLKRTSVEEKPPGRYSENDSQCGATSGRTGQSIANQAVNNTFNLTN